MSNNDIVCDCDLLRLMKRFSDRVYIKGSFCWLAGIKLAISNMTCANLPGIPFIFLFINLNEFLKKDLIFAIFISDECGTHLEKCHQNAFCDIDKDEDTSICTCKNGFKGSGISCEGNLSPAPLYYC